MDLSYVCDISVNGRSGKGFVLGNGWIMTNSHVLVNSEDICSAQFIFEKTELSDHYSPPNFERSAFSHLIASNVADPLVGSPDILLVKAAAKGDGLARLNDDTVFVGQELFVVCDATNPFEMSCCCVDIQQSEQNDTVLKLTANNGKTFEPGLSGSLVVRKLNNDLNNDLRIAGILFQKGDDPSVGFVLEWQSCFGLMTRVQALTAIGERLCQLINMAPYGEEARLEAADHLISSLNEPGKPAFQVACMPSLFSYVNANPLLESSNRIAQVLNVINFYDWFRNCSFDIDFESIGWYFAGIIKSVGFCIPLRATVQGCYGVDRFGEPKLARGTGAEYIICHYHPQTAVRPASINFCGAPRLAKNKPMNVNVPVADGLLAVGKYWGNVEYDVLDRKGKVSFSKADGEWPIDNTDVKAKIEAIESRFLQWREANLTKIAAAEEEATRDYQRNSGGK